MAQERLYQRVGDAIKGQRLGASLTRQELGERIGTTPARLQSIETGAVQCPLHLLVALADEFDTTLDALVPVVLDEASR